MSLFRGMAVLALLFTTVQAEAQDLEQIRERGHLKVIACTDEQPEVFSFEGGAHPGFEGELIRDFAKLHRISIEIVPAKTFEERIPRLIAGEADVAVGVVDTAERRRIVNLTVDILPVRHLVVSRAPHRVVETAEQFRSEKVGVVEGSTWAQAAEDAGVPSSESQGFSDVGEVLEALSSGVITATVMTVTDYTLAARRDPQLQAGVFVGAAGRAAWAVRQEDDQLLRALDEYLGNRRRTQTWPRLLVKYFGEQVLTVLGRAKHEEPTS